ncbi:hypothetical protein D3C77_587660 [compost metagenome]
MPVPLPIRIIGACSGGAWKLRLARMRRATSWPICASCVSQPEARPGVPSGRVIRRMQSSSRPSEGREATEYSRLPGCSPSRAGRPTSAMSPAAQVGAWSMGAKAR